MTDHRIGRVFVELDLDESRYKKGQKRLLSDAQKITTDIERNFKNLGIKSSAEMDLMRMRIHHAYEGIRKDSRATTNDIIRAEREKNAKLKEINEKQFGVQKSLLDKMKEHWVATAAIAYSVWKTSKMIVDKVASTIKEITWLSSKYETYGVVMRVVGNNAGYTGEQMNKFQDALQKNGIAMMESRRVLMMMAEAHINLNKSQELGRIAQNAAVIGMMNSSQAMENMIWGIQSANLRVLRTIGINVSFERSYQKLVDKLNLMNPAIKRTVENLTELEKITARTNEVIEFGPRIYGTYTAAMETAAKQALSLQRYWDNLKILAGSIFTPLFAQIVGDITGSIIDLNKDLRENKELMNEYGNQLRLNFIDVEIKLYQIISLIDKIKPKNMGFINFFAWLNPMTRLAKIEAKVASGFMKLTEEHVNKINELRKKQFEEETGLNWDVMQQMYQKEKASLSDKLKDGEQAITYEGKINDLYKVREKLLFSMTDEGKKQAKEREDAAEKERLALHKKIEEEQKAAEEKRKAEEAEMARQKKLAREREQLNKKITNDIEKNSIKTKQIGLSVMEAERKRIEETVKLYEKKGADQILIEKWARNEMILAAEKARKAQEKEELKHQKMLRKEYEKTYGKLITMSKETSKAMQSTFSDVFFDFMNDELKTLRDYALSFMRMIARSLANIFAQQATTGIINGIVSAYGASTASDQYPISEGDYYGPYSSPNTTSIKSQSMMSASGKMGDTYNVTVRAVDSKSFTQMVEENPQSVVTTVQKAMRNNNSLRNTIRRTT
jgi:hypothetical protein